MRSREAGRRYRRPTHVGPQRRFGSRLRARHSFVSHRRRMSTEAVFVLTTPRTTSGRTRSKVSRHSTRDILEATLGASATRISASGLPGRLVRSGRRPRSPEPDPQRRRAIRGAGASATTTTMSLRESASPGRRLPAAPRRCARVGGCSMTGCRTTRLSRPSASTVFTSRSSISPNPSFPDPPEFGSAPPANRYLLGDGLRLPRSTRVSAGIDQRLARALKSTVTYSYTRGVDGVERPQPERAGRRRCAAGSAVRERHRRRIRCQLASASASGQSHGESRRPAAGVQCPANQLEASDPLPELHARTSSKTTPTARSVFLPRATSRRNGGRAPVMSATG